MRTHFRDLFVNGLGFHYMANLKILRKLCSAFSNRILNSDCIFSRLAGICNDDLPIFIVDHSAMGPDTVC